MLVMVTVLLSLQTPWLTVQRKVLTPKLRLLTVLWACAGCATTPVLPPIADQLPVPTDGTTADKLPVPSQLTLDAPASALTPLFHTNTSALVVQMPLVTVHVKRLLPLLKLLTVVLAAFTLPITTVPVLLHTPLPIAGDVALRTAVLLHTLWSLPGTDVDGVLLVMFTKP